MGISDKATDALASVISGKNVKTMVVSIDEFKRQLDDVMSSVEKDEITSINKVIKGSFWRALNLYDTQNQKYRVSTLYAGTIGSNRLVNEISVMDLDTNVVYTCKSFLFKGKLKKACQEVINRYFV